MDFIAGQVLYFNKPLKWTSFDLVNKFRYKLSRKLKVKKIKVGHAGTLDPLATGVMIVCTGKATKRIDEFQYQTKEYVATLKLGETTPSFDLEKENGFFEMADSLVETLGLDETNELNLIISRILHEDLTDSVVFLTGVGKCHPIIASHNILNNLHQVLDSVPVVLFYPGEYSGQDLKLFGTMDSHNYYRAFRLV